MATAKKTAPKKGAKPRRRKPTGTRKQQELKDQKFKNTRSGVGQSGGSTRLTIDQDIPPSGSPVATLQYYDAEANRYLNIPLSDSELTALLRQMMLNETRRENLRDSFGTPLRDGDRVIIEDDRVIRKSVAPENINTVNGEKKAPQQTAIEERMYFMAKSAHIINESIVRMHNVWSRLLGEKPPEPEPPLNFDENNKLKSLDELAARFNTQASRLQEFADWFEKFM